MKQKIFVLYTGGTIGMTQSSAGLRPDTALVDKALAPFSDGLDFVWHVCQPLIDSSAVTLQNQRDWLELIIAKLPDYDGILVLHGTDTMAYTANLSHSRCKVWTTRYPDWLAMALRCRQQRCAAQPGHRRFRFLAQAQTSGDCL